MDVGELAQNWVHAMNQRDVETLRQMAHPDVEVHFLVSPGGGVWGGDFKEVYRGVDEAFVALAQWAEPWSELRLEIDRVEQEGEDQFVLYATWYGVGRGSGVELTSSDYVARYTLEGGKVRTIRFIEPPRQVEQPSG